MRPRRLLLLGLLVLAIGGCEGSTGLALRDSDILGAWTFQAEDAGCGAPSPVHLEFSHVGPSLSTGVEKLDGSWAVGTCLPLPFSDGSLDRQARTFALVMAGASQPNRVEGTLTAADSARAVWTVEGFFSCGLRGVRVSSTVGATS